MHLVCGRDVSGKIRTLLALLDGLHVFAAAVQRVLPRDQVAQQLVVGTQRCGRRDRRRQLIPWTWRRRDREDTEKERTIRQGTKETITLLN